MTDLEKKAAEKAEQIHKLCCNGEARGDRDFIALFASAIVEFAREAVEDEAIKIAAPKIVEQIVLARAEALEEAANHFRPQIRTYTGEQVAKALIDMRDRNFIRALAKEPARG